MSDQNGQSWLHRRTRPRLVREARVSLEGLPTAEELAEQPHQGDDADRFSLYTPAQVEAEARDVKICLTFGEPIRIRDQAEMVIAAMRAIIEKTRAHDLGSIRQRIECRAEAASCGRALSRFNGRTPHGDSRRKR